jgi:hypothetical protein
MMGSSKFGKANTQQNCMKNSSVDMIFVVKVDENYCKL